MPVRFTPKNSGSSVRFTPKQSSNNAQESLSSLGEKDRVEAIQSLKEQWNAAKAFADSASSGMDVFENAMQVLVEKFGPEGAKNYMRDRKTAIEGFTAENEKNAPVSSTLGSVAGITGDIAAGVVNPAFGMTQLYTGLGSKVVEEGSLVEAAKKNPLQFALGAIPPAAKFVSGAGKGVSVAKALTQKLGSKSKKVIEKLTNLTERVERAGGGQKGEVAEEISEIAGKIGKTKGFRVKTVENNLASEGVDIGDDIGNVYTTVKSMTGESGKIDMYDVVNKMVKTSDDLTNLGDDAAPHLLKEANAIKKSLDEGTMSRFKDPEEAWGFLKKWGEASNYDSAATAPVNQAKIYRRGALRKVVDEKVSAVQEGTGVGVLDDLKALNKKASLNIEAQKVLADSPLILKEFTPTAREIFMLGLGGIANKGTLGTLAGISSGARAVPAFRFAGAKALGKISEQGLERGFGGLASFSTPRSSSSLGFRKRGK